jgi:DNA-binding response OmpR family regulator
MSFEHADAGGDVMSHETILVIDQTSTPVATALTARGYRVITALDGNEAIATATNERPRLVVLNAVEPNMDGHRVCRQLKSDPATRDIRVLMLTGKPTETDTFWGMGRGADAYLAEPFVKDDLLSRVHRLI